MSRIRKAALILDPDRRDEQIAFVSGNAEILQEIGEQLWVSMPEARAEQFSERGISVLFQEGADLIELPAVTFDPAQEVPEPPADLRAAEPAAGSTAYYLVQFVAPPIRAWTSEILALGGRHVQSMPVNVGVFSLTASLATAVDELDYVTWVGPYHPAYALSYSLAGRNEPFDAVSLRNLAVDPESLPTAEEGNVVVRMFDDASPEDVRDAVEAAGAVVQGEMGLVLVLSADAATVSRLLRTPGILAVERHVRISIENDRAGVIMATEQVRSFGNINFLVNLDGSGEIVGVVDSGLDTGIKTNVHADLGNRVLQLNHLKTANTGVPDTDPHGTHVTGTIAGDGTASHGQIRGIAPACHVIFHGPVPGNPDVVAYYLQGMRNAHRDGARVHNNSYGWSDTVTNNAYLATWTEEVDRFCFSRPDSLLVFSSSNHEADANGDGILDMNRMSYYATAKNVLTVGAVENIRSDNGFRDTYRHFYPTRYNHSDFDPWAGGAPGAFTMSDNADQLALYSCRGLVNGSGGRVKPDLVAPGTNIVSLRSSQTPPPTPATGLYKGWHDPAATATHPNLPNLYMVMDGTSMAAPHVSGAAVLTRQYYRSRFGQLRRPVLLERVSPILDLPTIAPHRDGRVVAWVRHDSTSNPPKNDIVAARYSRDWIRRGKVGRLRSGVGDHPAPMLARHGNNTLLSHRADDGTVHLSLHDPTLAPVNTFGSGGTVTLAPKSRTEDSRRPAMIVRGDEAAVVWNQTGADALLFQRFRADTGASVDGAPKNLGDMTESSAHPFIAHNGTHYAVVWAHRDGADYKLQMRLIDDSGAPVGAQPKTLVTQAQEIHDPHFVWDPRQNRFLVVWVSFDAHPGGDVRYLFVEPDGSAVGAPDTASSVSGSNAMRQPYITLHPDRGYILLWEDNSQRDHYDVYMTFLDEGGQPDRIPRDPTDPIVLLPSPRLFRRLLRISDTPEDTSGLTALVDAAGVAVVWQSKDEVNSDLLGVYGLSVTPLGAFGVRADPDTPLVESGSYKNHVLLDHNQTSLTSVSMAWAGGSYYMIRRGPRSGRDHLEVVRTNADGLVDTTYGVGGARSLTTGRIFPRHEMHWTEDQLMLICASVGTFPGPHVFLLNNQGNPVPTFGAKGARRIIEMNTVSSAISPQLGHYTHSGFKIVFAYGTGRSTGAEQPPYKIRYAVLDAKGDFVTGPRDLTQADGTASHGWFHFVNTASPACSIAAWHAKVGGTTTVFVNRYEPDGEPHTRSDKKKDHMRLTELPGTSMNAVIAPRPVDIGSTQREYGAAWQYRPDPSRPWEIRFSRLDREGVAMQNPPAGQPPPKRDVPVVLHNPPHVTDWPSNTDAIEPQLVSTYTHEPWANPSVGTTPQWSPDYGLAWIGQPSGGGPRTLYFTALDENGSRVWLHQPPANGASRTEPAPFTPISTAGADVQDFRLVWNGRTFRLTWTEIEGGRLRHMQTALTRQGSRKVYDEPSSALLRATLINGATNIDDTALPNIPTPPITKDNRNHGYGWGRVNLRQSLAPTPRVTTPQVTFHVRDDNALGPGQSVRYRFRLPPGTALLRATLAWTDPPNTGATITNNLNLRIIPPGKAATGKQYRGNVWQAPPGKAHLSRLVSRGDSSWDSAHNVEQVVVQDPDGGVYEVEVIARSFGDNTFNQFNAQPYALVFVGSGPEVRFGGIPPGPVPGVY